MSASSVFGRLPGVKQILSLKALLLKMVRTLSQNAGTLEVMLHECDLKHNPRFMDPLRLLSHSTGICSMSGEDGIIREIFRRIGTTDRVFLEIGVGDGTCNNTAFLLSTGWTGYWIDGDPRFVKNIKDRADLAGCLTWKVSFVTAENVVGLLSDLNVPTEFDLFSLDIDQNTFYAWQTLVDYRPRVVVVEYNSIFPADCQWKVRYGAERVWNGTRNHGASLKSYELLGRKFGYSLVGCDYSGANAFFVRDDLVNGQFAAPFTADNHYEPPRPYNGYRPRLAPTILDRCDEGDVFGPKEPAGDRKLVVG